VKEKVSPEVNLPEKGLKISAQIEIHATTTASFLFQGLSMETIFIGKSIHSVIPKIN
jgi:hypothetical protein